jgi:heme-degrading monooxygenase HmoA
VYARSNTLRAHPDKVDDLAAICRDEIMPLVQGMDGCIGLSMLADRGTGRCIVTTAWETEEAMRASDQGVRESRGRAGQLAGGEAEVAEWEVAVMHRAHESHHGACTRVIWSRGDTGRMQDAIDQWRMSMLARTEELPGFCSVSLMVDRASGRAALAVTYDSRDTMMQAMEQGTAMREEFARAAGLEITDMAEFDLVLAHLRVPETV